MSLPQDDGKVARTIAQVDRAIGNIVARQGLLDTANKRRNLGVTTHTTSLLIALARTLEGAEIYRLQGSRREDEEYRYCMVYCLTYQGYAFDVRGQTTQEAIVDRICSQRAFGPHTPVEIGSALPIQIWDRGALDILAERWLLEEWQCQEAGRLEATTVAAGGLDCRPVGRL